MVYWSIWVVNAYWSIWVVNVYWSIWVVNVYPDAGDNRQTE